MATYRPPTGYVATIRHDGGYVALPGMTDKANTPVATPVAAATATAAAPAATSTPAATATAAAPAAVAEPATEPAAMACHITAWLTFVGLFMATCGFFRTVAFGTALWAASLVEVLPSMFVAFVAIMRRASKKLTVGCFKRVMYQMRRERTTIVVFLGAVALVNLTFVFDGYSGRCNWLDLVLVGMFDGLCYALLYVFFPLTTPVQVHAAAPTAPVKTSPWWLVLAVVAGAAVAAGVVASQKPKSKKE